MSKPFETRGCDKYGSSLGRYSRGPQELTGRCHLVRVRLDSGGYDKGGAYWGSGQPLFCAWDDEGNSYYCRAIDRENAKAVIHSQNQAVTFYR